MKSNWLATLLLLQIGACATHSVAQNAAIPQELLAWQDWVLHDSTKRCPISSDEQRCIWPGTLRLEIADRGAQFAQNASSYLPNQRLSLPGSADSHWPINVRLNGAEVPVLNVDGRPAIWVANAGAATIDGEFSWETRPEQLTLNSDVPVELRQNGVAVNNPERQGDELYLGTQTNVAREADALDVQVHRLLSDQLPLNLATNIELRVSGNAREALLGPALLPGFAPIALNGDLTAKLESDGSLRVQLKPGTWQLNLFARSLSPMVEFKLPKSTQANNAWPSQETLSLQTDPLFRTIRLEGLESIDPNQSEVPSEWRQMPAYLWDAEQSFTLRQESRGRDETVPNRLTLTRTLWLDFSGKGFSGKDQLSGVMQRDWRVSMRAPYVLTRAQAYGEDGLQPLLITKDTQGGGTGVELRTTNVSLQTSNRIEAPYQLGKSLAATGYTQVLDQANIALNTPPGWKLIAAIGASQSNSAWIDQWNVYYIFAAAILTVIAWRYLGFGFALATGLYVVLSMFEYQGPKYSLAFALLLLMLLRNLGSTKAAGKRSLRDSWFGKLVRYSSYAVLLMVSLQTIAFIQHQARVAIHPQLDYIGSSTAFTDKMGLPNLMSEPMAVPTVAAQEINANDAAAAAGAVMDAEQAPAPPPPPPPPRVQVSKAINEVASQNMAYLNQASTKRMKMQRYASNSVLQAGRAEPDWTWQQYQVSVAGPIAPDQTLAFVLTPPWLTGLLRFLMIALIGYVLYRIGRELIRDYRQPPSNAEKDAPTHGNRTASVLATSLLLVSALLSSSAIAQSTPDAQILETLRERLEQQPACAPNCVSLGATRVSAIGNQLEMRIIASVGATAEVKIPISERALADLSLTVDGQARRFDARDGDYRSLVLPRGVHTIIVRAVIRADRVVLAFPITPMHVEFIGTGWETNSIRDARLSSGTLDLARAAGEVAGDTPRDAGGTNQFPPYLRVTRQFQFDLNWKLMTRIERLTEIGQGITVRLPLLAGEQPLHPDVVIKDGMALYSLNQSQSDVEFESALASAEQLTLTAPALSERAEIWTVQSSPTWHVDASGIPQSLHGMEPSQQDVSQRFDPLPGETLTLKLTRPEPAPGPAFRIDSVNLSVSPGEKLRDSTLSFLLRATQGGSHTILLPKGSELIAISRDGSAQTLRLREQKLELPIHPGDNQFLVQIREKVALADGLRAPAIDLQLPAANVNVIIDVPNNRWLLWTRGPTLGPAILFWPTLFVILLIAGALAYSRRTALGIGEWFLLGLGLAGLGWAFVAIAAWFILLQYRLKHGQELGDWTHRGFQALLAFLTFLSVLIVLAGVANGLISHLDMQVTGNSSSAYQLKWFADLTDGPLPDARAYSAPTWLYKLLMLAWSLWLAFAAMRWLRYAWQAFSAGGIWRAFPVRIKAEPVVAETQQSDASATSTDALPPLPVKPE